MKQLLLLPLLLLTITLPMSSQINQDSLLKVSRNDKLPSEERLKALYEVAFYYSNKEPESALVWSDSLYNSADVLAVPLYKCKALNARSYAFQTIGDYEGAKLACDEGLEIARIIGDERSEAMFAYNLGRIYFQQEEYTLSLEYTEKAAEYFESIEAKDALYTCLSSIAMSHRNLGNNIGALNIYEEYIDKAKASGNKSIEANMLNSIGLLFFENMEDSIALGYHIQAFELAESVNDKITMSYTLSNMGSEYLNLNDYENAYKSLIKSLEIKRELGNTPGIIESYYNIGNYYQEREMPLEAMEYYNMSYELAVENQEYTDIVFNLVGKSISYNKLGKPKDAIQSAYDAIQLSTELEGQVPLGRQAIASQELYKAYKLEGPVDSALKYLEQFNTLNDLFEPSEKLSFAYKFERRMMDISYEQLNAELETEKLSAANKAKQNQLLGLAAAFLFILLLGTVVFFLRAQNVKKKQFEFEKRITSLRASHNRAEEERTRFARDLHDVVGSTITLALFNLQALKKSVEGEEKTARLHESTVDCIKTAMDDVRRISYDLMPKALESGGLVDALDELIEKTEASASFDIEWEASGIDQKLGHAAEVQLYKIIKELLSNSTKYADARLVRIDLSLLNGEFILKYDDNGKGVELESALERSKAKGQGLIGILERCELMGAHCEMDSSIGNGFDFKLTKNLVA